MSSASQDRSPLRPATIAIVAAMATLAITCVTGFMLGSRNITADQYTPLPDLERAIRASQDLLPIHRLAAGLLIGLSFIASVAAFGALQQRTTRPRARRARGMHALRRPRRSYAIRGLGSASTSWSLGGSDRPSGGESTGRCAAGGWLGEVRDLTRVRTRPLASYASRAGAHRSCASLGIGARRPQSSPAGTGCLRSLLRSATAMCAGGAGRVRRP